MSTGIKVFAPASVANVACGFDTLGFALEKPGDEIIARLSDKPGLRITKITGADGKLPYEVERNTAGLAALKLLEHLGEQNRGIELEIHKNAFWKWFGIKCRQCGSRCYGGERTAKTTTFKKRTTSFCGPW